MYVADDVKRPMLVAFVVPQRRPLDGRRLDLIGRVEDENVREALALHAAQRPPQLRFLLADDVRPERPVRASAVAVFADPFRQIENEGDRQAVVLAGKRDERPAGLGLDVGGVHHGQLAQRQPLAGDEMQNVERLLCHRLVVFVVAHHTAAVVGREYLGRQEVLARTCSCRSRWGR